MAGVKNAARARVGSKIKDLRRVGGLGKQISQIGERGLRRGVARRGLVRRGVARVEEMHWGPCIWRGGRVEEEWGTKPG